MTALSGIRAQNRPLIVTLCVRDGYIGPMEANHGTGQWARAASILLARLLDIIPTCVQLHTAAGSVAVEMLCKQAGVACHAVKLQERDFGSQNFEVWPLNS